MSDELKKLVEENHRLGKNTQIDPAVLDKIHEEQDKKFNRTFKLEDIDGASVGGVAPTYNYSTLDRYNADGWRINPTSTGASNDVTINIDKALSDKQEDYVVIERGESYKGIITLTYAAGLTLKGTQQTKTYDTKTSAIVVGHIQGQWFTFLEEGEKITNKNARLKFTEYLQKHFHLSPSGPTLDHDAKNKKIFNLADGTNTKDAINKGQLDLKMDLKADKSVYPTPVAADDGKALVVVRETSAGVTKHKMGFKNFPAGGGGSSFFNSEELDASDKASTSIHMQKYLLGKGGVDLTFTFDRKPTHNQDIIILEMHPDAATADKTITIAYPEKSYINYIQASSAELPSSLTKSNHQAIMFIGWNGKWNFTVYSKAESDADYVSNLIDFVGKRTVTQDLTPVEDQGLALGKDDYIDRTGNVTFTHGDIAGLQGLADLTPYSDFINESKFGIFISPLTSNPDMSMEVKLKAADISKIHKGFTVLFKILASQIKYKILDSIGISPSDNWHMMGYQKIPAPNDKESYYLRIYIRSKGNTAPTTLPTVGFKFDFGALDTNSQGKKFIIVLDPYIARGIHYGVIPWKPKVTPKTPHHIDPATSKAEVTNEAKYLISDNVATAWASKVFPVVRWSELNATYQLADITNNVPDGFGMGIEKVSVLAASTLDNTMELTLESPLSSVDDYKGKSHVTYQIWFTGNITESIVTDVDLRPSSISHGWKLDTYNVHRWFEKPANSAYGVSSLIFSLIPPANPTMHPSIIIDFDTTKLGEVSSWKYASDSKKVLVISSPAITTEARFTQELTWKMQKGLLSLGVSTRRDVYSLITNLSYTKQPDYFHQPAAVDLKRHLNDQFYNLKHYYSMSTQDYSRPNFVPLSESYIGVVPQGRIDQDQALGSNEQGVLLAKIPSPKIDREQSYLGSYLSRLEQLFSWQTNPKGLINESPFLPIWDFLLAPIHGQGSGSLWNRWGCRNVGMAIMTSMYPTMNVPFDDAMQKITSGVNLSLTSKVKSVGNFNASGYTKNVDHGSDVLSDLLTPLLNGVILDSDSDFQKEKFDVLFRNKDSYSLKIEGGPGFNLTGAGRVGRYYGVPHLYIKLDPRISGNKHIYTDQLTFGYDSIKTDDQLKAFTDDITHGCILLLTIPVKRCRPRTSPPDPAQLMQGGVLNGFTALDGENYSVNVRQITPASNPKSLPTSDLIKCKLSVETVTVTAKYNNGAKIWPYKGTYDYHLSKGTLSFARKGISGFDMDAFQRKIRAKDFSWSARPPVYVVEATMKVGKEENFKFRKYTDSGTYPGESHNFNSHRKTFYDNTHNFMMLPVLLLGNEPVGTIDELKAKKDWARYIIGPTNFVENETEISEVVESIFKV